MGRIPDQCIGRGDLHLGWAMHCFAICCWPWISRDRADLWHDLRPASATAWATGRLADLAEKVVMIICGHLGIDRAAVDPAASVTDDLGADSLDTVELVMAFEEEFGIEIPKTMWSESGL